MPNINALQTELQSIPGFNGANNQAAQVGTAISFVPAVAISPTYSLSRKPATSALTLGAGSFTAGVLTPDVPGLYQGTVTNAGVAGPTFQVLAVPAGALAATAPFFVTKPDNTRVQMGLAQFASLMGMLGFSATTCAASIELASPGAGFLGIDARILGGAAATGLPWAAFV